MSRRPPVIVVGKLRARVIRGPRADGAWYWRGEVHEDGGHRTVWTGWGDRDGVSDHLVALVAGGGLHRESSAAESTEIRTVRDLLECWLGAQLERSDLRPATLATYRSHARVLADLLGAVAVDRLARRDLDGYVRRVRAPPAEGQVRRSTRAGSSIALDWIVLGAAWSWGRSIGVAPDRDLVFPEVDARPVRAKHTPTPGEVAAVLEHLPAWAASVVRLQWSTGARIGEIAALRVRDLDARACTLRLQGKTGARTFPLVPSMVRELLDLAAGRGADDRIFVQRVETIRHVNDHLHRACEAAGVADWSTHALRRSAVDRLLRSPGVDVATAADLLGHSPAVLLKSYRQVNDADRRAAVAAALRPLPSGDLVDLETARTGRAHKPRKA
jgi:integrase